VTSTTTPTSGPAGRPGAETTEPRTYGNWRKPSTPGLPGLGLLGTVAALGGVVLVVLVQMLAGLLPALVVLAVVAAAVLPLLYRNRSGRNGWQAAAARVLWLRGRRARQHLFRSGLLAPAACGGATLPGLLAPSVLYEAVDAYGAPFALLHVPATRHYSVVLRCDPEGSALVDPETSDTWVARWGRWLAELPREPHLEAASATVETAPDPGSRLAREVQQLLTDGAPELARRMLTEVADTYALGSPQVTGRVSLTFTATRRVSEDSELFAGRTTNTAGSGAQGAAGSGGKSARRARVLTPAEMAAQVGSRLPALLRELATTGAGGVRALTAAELAQTVRVAYDPAAGPVLDGLHAHGQDPQVDWAGAGPAGQLEGWGSLRHDTGTSVTWQMTEAPRGAVQSQVLRAILEPCGELTRKRVTLLYRPHDPASAARIADADVRTALGKATMRKGETRAQESSDLTAARQTAGEEAAGAGLTRFSLLVTATVTDPAGLAHAADLIDQAGGASRLRLRRVYAGQSASFAAALGVGLVLPAHVAVPAVLRQYL
jgi:hypothetical protein